MGLDELTSFFVESAFIYIYHYNKSVNYMKISMKICRKNKFLTDFILISTKILM